MTAPSWHEDDPRNLSLIQSNAAQLITELRALAAARILPTPEELCRWHARLYAGCDVPVVGYVGHFRGDPTVKELVDYEVGLGVRLKDGNLEKMGLWARTVGDEMKAVLAGLHAVFTELDARLPVGRPPATAGEILEVVSLRRLHTVNSCGSTRSPTATVELPGCWSRSSASGTSCRCSCISSRGRKARTTSARAATRWAAHPTS